MGAGWVSAWLAAAWGPTLGPPDSVRGGKVGPPGSRPWVWLQPAPGTEHGVGSGGDRREPAYLHVPKKNN